MLLSELIAYKTRLERMLPLDTAPLMHDKLAPLLHEVVENSIQFPDLTDQLQDQYNQLQQGLARFEIAADSVCDELLNLIQQYEKSYFESSHNLYTQMMEHDSVDHILSRRFNLTDHAVNFLQARIGAHSDWQHAGMIIRPGHEEWVTQMVGCDPLYLVDTSAELIEPAVLRFNDQYQRRLRTYVVNEAVDAPILERLPNSQFAYCLIYNFFHYKPLEIVQSYLRELWQKLKPGGEIGFTFNNCDTAGATALAERSFMCYTPGRLIMSYAAELGFELRQRYQIDAACTWVELRKPGNLESLRGGQSLAKINVKNT